MISLVGSRPALACFSTLHAIRTVSSLSFQLHNPSILERAIAIHDGQAAFDVLDPGSKDGKKVIARCPLMDGADAKRLIEQSAAALPPWRDGTTALHRSKILLAWSDEIKANAEDIATIMTMESGKPMVESRGEVNYAVSFLDYYAGEAIRPTGAGGGFVTPTTFTSGDGAPRGRIMAIQEAVGVTAMITPWNFPAAMITRKVGPALAAGCSVIVKPSELTPLTAIALWELGKKAGIPDGILQVITADGNSTPGVGEEFCVNSIVKKISFTGSTAVGKLLIKQSANTVKKLSLELGGNAPFLVFSDADIDRAVDAAVASKFRNAGQTCVCADRFLVHQEVEQEFVSKLAKKVGDFKVGHGTEEETTMGPLITPAAAEKVQAKVNKAIAEGGKLILGGSSMPDAGPNFFQPTIIVDVNTSSSLWRDETFGPVAAIRSFQTEDEAIELANDSSVGLASYFCSKDLERVFRVSGAIEAGIVGVNDGIVSSMVAPFGGVKESGLGREGSSMGIAEYLETKYVFINA